MLYCRLSTDFLLPRYWYDMLLVQLNILPHTTITCFLVQTVVPIQILFQKSYKIVFSGTSHTSQRVWKGGLLGAILIVFPCLCRLELFYSFLEKNHWITSILLCVKLENSCQVSYQTLIFHVFENAHVLLCISVLTSHWILRAQITTEQLQHNKRVTQKIKLHQDICIYFSSNMMMKSYIKVVNLHLAWKRFLKSLTS